MLVDPNQFPGPALWQGLMFLSTPVYFFLLFGLDQPEIALAFEVILGIALFIWIIAK